MKASPRNETNVHVTAPQWRKHIPPFSSQWRKNLWSWKAKSFHWWRTMPMDTRYLTKFDRKSTRLSNWYIAGSRDMTVPITTLAQPLQRRIQRSKYSSILWPFLFATYHQLHQTPTGSHSRDCPNSNDRRISNQTPTIKAIWPALQEFAPSHIPPKHLSCTFLAFLRKYKLSSDQLYKSPIHQLYRFLINTACPHLPADHIWRSAHRHSTIEPYTK